MARDDEAKDQAEAEAWRAIVDNYGERPRIEPEPPAAPEPAPDVPAAEEPVWFHAEQDDAGFVPPEPPPVPRPPTDRLAAWLGVLGVPVLVLLCIVVGIDLPAWAGLLLTAAFIGGFVYLVARLPGSPPDPSDDGARL